MAKVKGRKREAAEEKRQREEKTIAIDKVAVINALAPLHSTASVDVCVCNVSLFIHD